MLLILAFASVYQRLGIIDSTAEGSPITHSFATAIYYSIVTFTTLGYGDFYPTGLGRAVAAMQALTGYLILGILASTGASILSPREEPAKDEDLAAEG
ncbi:MAG TPA: ion channel [Longimicrobiaceae bacterium]|nr:ion channel [Longimicrobiaceae bacterium]